MTEQITDHKKEQIIATALKRFAHFGIAKTTMNEIADDLSLSKASLYYYFPDKTSLILAVGHHILFDFVKQQEATLNKALNFKAGMQNLIDIRIEFGKKYFMMHIGDGQGDSYFHDQQLHHLMEDVRQQEQLLLMAFMKKMQQQGELKALDIVSTSQIFTDVLTGIWVFEIHVIHKTLIPSDDQFNNIRTKCLNMLNIFYDGIKRA